MALLIRIKRLLRPLQLRGQLLVRFNLPLQLRPQVPLLLLDLLHFLGERFDLLVLPFELLDDVHVFLRYLIELLIVAALNPRQLLLNMSELLIDRQFHLIAILILHVILHRLDPFDLRLDLFVLARDLFLLVLDLLSLGLDRAFLFLRILFVLLQLLFNLRFLHAELVLNLVFNVEQ